MKAYVAGFLFSPCGRQVALIEKRNPPWQRGLLNGIGGKIEPGESPPAAMAREFLEEAGLDTRPEDWTRFLRLTRPEVYVVDFFFCRDGRIDAVRSMEAEEVGLYDTRALPTHMMPNLRWLIPLALDPELVFDAPVEMEERTGARSILE